MQQLKNAPFLRVNYQEKCIHYQKKPIRGWNNNKVKYSEETWNLFAYNYFILGLWYAFSDDFLIFKESSTLTEEGEYQGCAVLFEYIVKKRN